MSEMNRKINEINLILDNDFLFNHLVIECESAQDKNYDNELLKKKILKNAKKNGFSFINISKVACFVLVSVLLWNCGFSSFYPTEYTIIHEETNPSKFEEFNEYFKKFSYEVKNLNFGKEK
jgi:hypothetical protein